MRSSPLLLTLTKIIPRGHNIANKKSVLTLLGFDGKFTSMVRQS